MKMAKDVIVYDTEIGSLSSVIESYIQDLSACMQTYRTIIQMTVNRGLVDDIVTSRLNTLSNEIAKQQSVLNSLANAMTHNLKQFVNDMDSADRYIY